MSEPTPDVSETLDYRTDALLAEGLPFALFFVLLGLVSFALMETKAERLLAGGGALAIGIGIIAYGLYRNRTPSAPLFSLSPQGVTFRYPRMQQFTLAWQDVEAIDVVDVATFFPSSVLPRRISYKHVTALRVTRALYETTILEPSQAKGGPVWGLYFVVGDDHVQVALHHEMVGAERAALRRAVEARWAAFHAKPEASVFGSGAQAQQSPTVVRGPSQPMTLGRGVRLVQIAALLSAIAVVIANIVGVWQLPSQKAARSQDDAWEVQRRTWEAEDRVRAEEQRKRDKDWEEFRRRN